jgi:hypothetical protein
LKSFKEQIVTLRLLEYFLDIFERAISWIVHEKDVSCDVIYYWKVRINN